MRDVSLRNATLNQLLRDVYIYEERLEHENAMLFKVQKMSRRLYIIAYDISCSKARRKVAHLLQNWRMEGQKSLAECWLSTVEFTNLWEKLATHLDDETDHILALNQDLRSHDLALGKAKIYAGQTLIVG